MVIGQHRRVRLRALSVFERIVYHCACIDPRIRRIPSSRSTPCCGTATPTAPAGRGRRLQAHARLRRRDGVHFADSAARAAPRSHDGVEYLAFPMWETTP